MPIQALDELPRVSLAHLPTRLEAAPRLGAALGLPQLWVKRDDATGLALGGNKARKLEYVVADAVARGATTLLTTGGAQSNHARMTAAAACRHGLRCVLFLTDDPPEKIQGNLLLDRLFGAEIRFVGAGAYAEADAAMESAATELASAGETAYIIPVGGSTPLGALGYVRAMRELAQQAAEAGVRPAAIAVTVGSCGTAAGMFLGARLFLPECRVLGISVSRPAGNARRQAAELANQAAALLGVQETFTADECPVYDDWVGPGYGIPTPEGLEAIDLAARLEGLLLDPVYTGKALAGVRGLAERGELAPDAPTVFWHTGGAPALFAFADLIMNQG